MKKSLIYASVSLLSLPLFACNDISSSQISSSIESSTFEEAATESSSSNEESSDIESSSSDEPSSLNWSNESVSYMKKYLNGFSSIPFPIGFSSNYVDASGADEEEDFNAYEFLDTDLTSSYEKQLFDAGFILAEADDPSFEGRIYSFQIKDSNDTVIVETEFVYPNTSYSRFDIYAYYEFGAPKSDCFPYEAINPFFNTNNISSENLPPFDLKEDEKYDYYPSGEMYIVGGYFDTSLQEDNYVSSYQSRLENVGYLVNDGVGFNSNIGLKVEFMASEGYFFIQLSKYVAPKPGLKCISIDSSCFNTSYPTSETSFTKGGYSFYYANVSSNKGAIQFRSAAKGAGYIYNDTKINNLDSICINVDSSVNVSYYTVLSVYVSSSKISSSNVGEKIEPTYKDNAYAYSFENANYFKIVSEGDYASLNSSININFMS